MKAPMPDGTMGAPRTISYDVVASKGNEFHVQEQVVGSLATRKIHKFTMNGMPIGVVDADGFGYRMVYDIHGNVVGELLETPSGPMDIATFQSTPEGRLLSSTQYGVTESYRSNPLGQFTNYTSPQGSVQQFYNLLGLPTNTIVNFSGRSGENYQFTNKWDECGRPIGLDVGGPGRAPPQPLVDIDQVRGCQLPDVSCEQQICNNGQDWKFAWCPELCSCVSACLCMCNMYDPFTFECISSTWYDEWNCDGPNPLGNCDNYGNCSGLKSADRGAR